jgi:hypothetical protein
MKYILDFREIAGRDHFRRIVALISGSCVFMNNMLSVVPDYKDGEIIVVYDSVERLRDNFVLKS